MISARFGKNQKPLFVIDEPVKAQVYRANFKPFASTHFLDQNKIRKARQLSLEVGTIEAAGKSATLVAEIKKGMITQLTVQGCAGCDQKRKGGLSKDQRKVLAAIKEKASTIRGGVLTLPIPFPRKFAAGVTIDIPIWPFPPIIVITIEGPDTWCFAIRIGGLFCFFCLGVGGDCL